MAATAVWSIFTPDPVKRSHPYPSAPAIHETGCSDSTFMAGPPSQGPETVCLPNPRPDHSATSSTTAGNPSITLPYANLDDSRPEHHNLSSIASAGLRTSPSPLADRSRPQSPHLMATGSTPERQSNLQTAQAALGAFDHREEKSDAPASRNQSMESASKSMLRSPDERNRAGSGQPRSASPAAMNESIGNGENNNAGTTPTLINSSTVASPGPIEEHSPSEERPHHLTEPMDDANKSYSYPGPLPSSNLNDARRGMSLPHSGYNKASSRSPGSKKHKCEFCSTEFTRHHNLKSHLLTHSQEKPYICGTCHSRFRRLHDLKRHTKLHTGERPHICPKCGRRFARGDALARHNKGSGGCAGRRSSMGSFAGGEDEFGDGSGGAAADDAMEGLMYTEPERIDEEDERKLTLPSIRRHDSPSNDHLQANSGRHVSFQSHAPSTYPPPGINRPPQGGLFPPVSTQAGSSSSASPISPSANTSFPHSGTSGSSTYAQGQHGSSPSIFAQTTMTESPKPLSPSAMSTRQLGHSTEGNAHSHQRQLSSSHAAGHSPNSKPQLPSQQQFGRGSHGSATGLGIPPTLNLPAPQSGAPQLPPPPGLNQPDARYTLQAPQSQTQSRSPLISPALNSGRPDPHTQHPHHSHNRSNTDRSDVHDTNAKSNTNNNNTYPQQQQHSPQRQLSNPNAGAPSASAANDRLWGYVRALEDRMGGLESEVVRLREQLAVAQGGVEGHGASVTNGS